MDRIIQEKISADHLLYVSLKYTKTGDVILNLLKRWVSMVDETIRLLLENAKDNKKISVIPVAPKLKVDAAKNLYKKNKAISEGFKLYDFFKVVPKLEKLKEFEFRKNITLKVNDGTKWISINLETLREYSAIMDSFVNEVKKL
ncbi:hypothetical protein COU61_04545 [Candidatus Pacearchaeota archaeon CG10_big_fil_rev_8_21_14_0_10_35_13]|nr:MAG: hypothetical protein COU61_04545 [Candidatus Pacearchaeota archaeon CG10_big_fil_rev_8_21_14_0_10_35_13]